MYASVAVPVPVRRLFTYRVEAGLAREVGLGVRVRVPFGPRKVVGTVVGWPAEPPEDGVETRGIDAIVEGDRRLSPELLELTRFVADYYLCSWGDAIETALPPRVPDRVRTYVQRVAGARLEDIPARAPARRRAFEALPADGAEAPADRFSSADRRALRALAADGKVAFVERTDTGPQPARSNLPRAEPPHPPTAAQSAILERLRPALDSGVFSAFLLFGETGSGKTEVYFRAAEHALAAGRGVIYLVPEIGLTPLLLSQVSRRFPGQAEVLHSALPARERHAAWQRLADGRSRFVIGTRSAVFAPVAAPGLIVVDEEQDTSYKQAETPRYNGRDLAVLRARSAGATVVLGSATPSLESFQHARAGRYELLKLGARIAERALPEVELVDMREEYRGSGEIRPLSGPLRAALEECLGRGQQALVLRNRRGWAIALYCPTCGGRVACPNCSLSLTWHRADRRLRCHTCNFETVRPETCPECGAEELKLLGEGTEQIEQHIRDALPAARIARMDRDVLRSKGAHAALLRRFAAGEIDILVGTQMIAKGHHFPRVTLVGIVAADHALGLPDFRAGERTFQLLTQVAGRAGRGELPGRVVAQAFQPEHPLLRLAAAQDYERFFEREVGYRRALRYPPFAALVLLLGHDKDPYKTREWAQVLARAVRQEGGERLLLSGPGPAPIERIKGKFRQQILVRSAGRRKLVEAVDRALAAVEGEVPRRAIVVDVDPLSVL